MPTGFLGDDAVAMLLALIVSSVVLWEIWRHHIWPLLIPKAEIERLADELTARYGPRAEQMAYVEEDRAWRYCDPFEEGKWRRVRHELWRRYDAGEWG